MTSAVHWEWHVLWDYGVNCPCTVPDLYRFIRLSHGRLGCAWLRE